MEIADINQWLGALALVISIGGAAYAWLNAGSKNNAEALKASASRLDSHGARIQSLEDAVRHLPAKDDVHELKLGLAKLEGTVGQVGERLDGVKRVVDRLDTYLRKEA